MSAHRLLGAAALCLLLAACGGGGGGDSGPSVTPSTGQGFNAGAAYHNMLATNHAWILSGTANDTHSYTVAFGFAPNGSGSFPLNNISYTRTTQSLAVAQSGNSATASNSTFFYTNDQIVGIQNDDGTCELVTMGATLPSSNAQVGDTGTLYTAVLYPSCTGGTIASGSATAVWSIETHGGSTFFCVTTTEKNSGGSTTATAAECLQIGTDGTIGTLARVTLTDATGFSLTATN